MNFCRANAACLCVRNGESSDENIAPPQRQESSRTLSHVGNCNDSSAWTLSRESLQSRPQTPARQECCSCSQGYCVFEVLSDLRCHILEELKHSGDWA